jgi:putative restriction endonuclease
VNVEGELRLRERIMYLLTQAGAASADGTLSRSQLSAFDVDGAPRRLIDRSRGIWNPKELLATLAIVSSPTGPYADERWAAASFVMTTVRVQMPVTIRNCGARTS